MAQLILHELLEARFGTLPDPWVARIEALSAIGLLPQITSPAPPARP